MTYLEFHKQWHELGCFSIHQIYAWQPNFNRVNLHHWEKKGYIVKLRKEYYAFADFKAIPDSVHYIANLIYRPSYISLQTALAFYGMIPEAVVQTTSVTTLKTTEFSNPFGNFSYQSVKPDIMFGYQTKTMVNGRTILLATPEKALLDLLYLNSFYTSTEDMIELRLDEDFMVEEFNVELFMEYVKRTNSAALMARAETLIRAYEL